MDVKSIKTEEDYRATLHEVESLMSAATGSPEGERLDVLVTLISGAEEGNLIAQEARRQSLLVSGRRSESETLDFIEQTADTQLD